MEVVEIKIPIDVQIWTLVKEIARTTDTSVEEILKLCLEVGWDRCYGQLVWIMSQKGQYERIMKEYEDKRKVAP